METNLGILAEYSRVFPGGNRNAASHRWSKFLIERSVQIDLAEFVEMFQGFCAISGSPIRSGRADGTRYAMTLDTVSGTTRTGYLHFCCWPCVCDTQDFVRVDTRSVRLLDGTVKQFWWLVIGNPCLDKSRIPYEAAQVRPANPAFLEEAVM